MKEIELPPARHHEPDGAYALRCIAALVAQLNGGVAPRVAPKAADAPGTDTEACVGERGPFA
jgi:hypothetical protein